MFAYRALQIMRCNEASFTQGYYSFNTLKHMVHHLICAGVFNHNSQSSKMETRFISNCF
jgi:hypothetical protein